MPRPSGAPTLQARGAVPGVRLVGMDDELVVVLHSRRGAPTFPRAAGPPVGVRDGLSSVYVPRRWITASAYACSASSAVWVVSVSSTR